MTRDEATEFAARITDAIGPRGTGRYDTWQQAVNRARVARDLAGYLRALDGLAMHYEYTGFRPHTCNDCGTRWPCPDAERYIADRDDRMAALTVTGVDYGVTS